LNIFKQSAIRHRHRQLGVQDWPVHIHEARCLASMKQPKQVTLEPTDNTHLVEWIRIQWRSIYSSRIKYSTFRLALNIKRRYAEHYLVQVSC